VPPKRARQSLQIATMRAISPAKVPSTANPAPGPGGARFKSMGRRARRAGKPACISAATERARARAAGSSGQSPASGNRSCRYSAIARVSQTASPSAFSIGTRPLGLCARIAALVSGRFRGTTTSSKGAPVSFSMSQPRSDQDE